MEGVARMTFNEFIGVKKMLGPFFGRNAFREYRRGSVRSERLALSRRFSRGSEPTPGERHSTGRRPGHNDGVQDLRPDPLLC